MYGTSPRYQSAPGLPSSRPLLSPSSPEPRGGNNPGPYSTICLQSNYIRDPIRDQTALRNHTGTFRDPPGPFRDQSFREPLARNPSFITQNRSGVYTTNPRNMDHIYQVCMWTWFSLLRPQLKANSSRDIVCFLLFSGFTVFYLIPEKNHKKTKTAISPTELQMLVNESHLVPVRLHSD